MDGLQLKGEMDDELVKYLLKRREELSKRETDGGGFATEYGPMLGGIYQGAAQLGTLGGKAPSAKPFTDTIAGLQAREAGQEARDAAKRKELWGVDEKIATYLQEKRKRADDLKYKDKELSLRQSDLDLKKKQAQDLANYRTAALNKKAGTGAALPIDRKKQIENIATRQAGLTTIHSQVASMLREFQNAQSDQDKVRIGMQMIKPLNSLQGPDAVGNEEAQRLANALQYQIINLFGPGQIHGRDLSGFERQVISTLNSLEKSHQTNEQALQALKSGNEIRLETPAAVMQGEDGEALAAPILTDELLGKDPSEMSLEELEEHNAQLRSLLNAEQ